MWIGFYTYIFINLFYSKNASYLQIGLHFYCVQRFIKKKYGDSGFVKCPVFELIKKWQPKCSFDIFECSILHPDIFSNSANKSTGKPL